MIFRIFICFMIYACVHDWIFIYYIAVRADSLTAPVFVSVKYIQFMTITFYRL